jgi:hypothetical protein
LKMATKRSKGSEQRKHLITPSVQRKEKSQKTSKTDGTVMEGISNTTLSEKKNTVFYILSVVSLGRPEVMNAISCMRFCVCMYTCRDIFVSERAGMPFRKFFLKRVQAGASFQNIFPGIGITNPPLPPNFVTMRSGNFPFLFL